MRGLVVPLLVVVAWFSAGQNHGAAQRQPRPPAGPTQGSAERVLSPTVVGAWFTHSDAPGSNTLDLLVLWRGSPGWFLRGGSSGGSGGGDGTGRRSLSVRYDDLVLQVMFDGLARVVEIDGRNVPLNDDNVVLVDDVDSAAGLKVVKTLRVDPTLPDATRVEIAIRRSPELVAYLRCDLKLPDARRQAMMDLICAQVIGK